MVHAEVTRAGSGRVIESDLGAVYDPRTQIAKLRDFIARDWLIERDRGAGMRDTVRNVEIAVLGLGCLREEIKKVREASLPREMYRASKACRTHAPEDSPEYFLPPCAADANGKRRPEGRFNDIGQRALYLASQDDILQAEMTQQGRPGEFVVARFHIDPGRVRIANLLPSATVDLPYVNALVGEAERKRTTDARHTESDPYPHTIYLRHELEDAGFQGAIYPSVHDNHKEDPAGYNLVVFAEELFDRIIIGGWTDDVSCEAFQPVPSP